MATIKEQNSPFAENLRAYLESKGITQTHVDRKIGKEPGYIYDILAGKRLAKASDIAAISAALEVDPGELMKA